MTIPQKFMNPDGQVNLPALMQSYTHLGGNPADHIDPLTGTIDSERLGTAYGEREKVQSQIKQPEPVPVPVPVQQVNVKEPTAPAQINWGEITIGPDGKIPPAQRQALITAGTPEEFIDRFEAGTRAIQENQIHRITSQLPGGAETYQALIQWVNQNFDLEERRRVHAALAGEGAEFAVQGLYSRYAEANPQAAAGATPAGEPRMNVDTSGGGAGAAPEGVPPFETADERNYAFSHPRYRVDKEYRDHVQARIRATSAAVAEQQKTNPSRGWRAPQRRESR